MHATRYVEKERVYWVDIYKALAIILVVVGHSTGRFNAFIYQFHVAAFFFISGWVSKQDEESFGRDFYKKFISLIIPLFFSVIVSGIFIQLLKMTGAYAMFYEADAVPDFPDLIRNFLSHGLMIDLLGAAWFVEVLFIASLLSHILWRFSHNKNEIFLGLTILVYLFGYWLISSGAKNALCLSIVAQGYYGVAFIIKRGLRDKKFKGGIKRRIITEISIFVITFMLMILMKKYLQSECIMDLSSGKIDNILWSTIAVVNGVLWLYSASKLISYIKIKALKMAICAIGQNTMAIMLLHFVSFRILFCCFYYCGVAEAEELRNLVPSAKLGDQYWFIFASFAIIFSILVWRLLGKIPVVSQLLGINRSLAGMISNFEVSKQIVWVYKRVCEVVVQGWKDFCLKTWRKETRKQLLVYWVIVIVAILFCIIPVAKDKSLAISNTEQIEGPISITFPYLGSAISFGRGWLLQSEDEDYRWVQQESEMSILLGDQSKIVLIGYVPTGIDNISNMKIYLNDFLICETDVGIEEMISVEADFKGHKVDGENIIKIVFDDMHIPEISDNDQRSFSAMFTSILIE